jgi:hypothetical protein
MGAVPVNKAGIGSAMNDATREVGGTLGVAVIGSVYASLYASGLADSDSVKQLPSQVESAVSESVGSARIAAEQLGAAGDVQGAQAVSDAAGSAFLDGLAAGSYVAAAVTLVGAVVAAAFLPSRPARSNSDRHRGEEVGAR